MISTCAQCLRGSIRRYASSTTFTSTDFLQVQIRSFGLQLQILRQLHTSFGLDQILPLVTSLVLVQNFYVQKGTRQNHLPRKGCSFGFAFCGQGNLILSLLKVWLIVSSLDTIPDNCSTLRNKVLNNDSIDSHANTIILESKQAKLQLGRISRLSNVPVYERGFSRITKA